MHQELVVRSLPQAYKIIKEMDLPQESDVDYRSASRDALIRVLEDRMKNRIDRYLEKTGRHISDRRNGHLSGIY